MNKRIIRRNMALAMLFIIFGLIFMFCLVSVADHIGEAIRNAGGFHGIAVSIIRSFSDIWREATSNAH